MVARCKTCYFVYLDTCFQQAPCPFRPLSARSVLIRRASIVEGRKNSGKEIRSVLYDANMNVFGPDLSLFEKRVPDAYYGTGL